MKTIYKPLFIALLLVAAACNKPKPANQTTTMETAKQKVSSGYATVNGLKMYYEIVGEGDPLVLIHGGGSTIQTTFGKVINTFAKNRKIIAVELQSHGHTEDKDRPFTFEQDADDVVALLKHLNIDSADFFGFSNGAMTTLQITIRHPQTVRKAIVASAIYKRSGMPDVFWEFMKGAKLDNMPPALQQAYKEVAPNPENIIKMHDKCAQRMVNFVDWKNEDLQAIQAPVLIINSDADVVLPEHAMTMYRLIPHSNLLVFAGAHGQFIGEATAPPSPQKNYDASVTLIEDFLNKDR